MAKQDASTQTLSYQLLPAPPHYTKVKLLCENCELSWLHQEKEHLLLYYCAGLKYCLDCRHTIDEFESLRSKRFPEKVNKWVHARSSFKKFKCCFCRDVRLHHHLGDGYFGRIPVVVNAAVPQHILCMACFNDLKIMNSESPQKCQKPSCQDDYYAGMCLSILNQHYGDSNK